MEIKIRKTDKILRTSGEFGTGGDIFNWAFHNSFGWQFSIHKLSLVYFSSFPEKRAHRCHGWLYFRMRICIRLPSIHQHSAANDSNHGSMVNENPIQLRRFYCLFLSLLIYLTQLNQLIITKWNKYPYWSMFSMSKCDNTCVHMSESSMFSSYNHYIPIKSNTRTEWLNEAVVIHVQYTQENESRWAKWKIAARKCAG